VLAAPVVNGLVADAEHLGDLLDRAPGLDQVQNLATKLRRIGTRREALSGCWDQQVFHRMVDRLGEEMVQRMIEERRAGVEMRELAKRYGVSLSSVKRILRAGTWSASS
jgi:hypothetical protein